MGDLPIADIIELEQLLARYAVGMTKNDVDAVVEVFTPDGTYSAFGDTYQLADFPTLVAAAPKGLSGVANVGAISLIWDANTESDLAGYIVLRGEVPGDKLEAITPAPIRETTFTDKTVVPGTRYVYAIVAVDRATPANTSPQSARVEETAR